MREVFLVLLFCKLFWCLEDFIWYYFCQHSDSLSKFLLKGIPQNVPGPIYHFSCKIKINKSIFTPTKTGTFPLDSKRTLRKNTQNSSPDLPTGQFDTGNGTANRTGLNFLYLFDSSWRRCKRTHWRHNIVYIFYASDLFFDGSPYNS